jgi:small GTP-binding protein
MLKKDKPIRLKTVNLGFDGAGKTSLYYTFAYKNYPEGFVASIFECYIHNFKIEGHSVDLGFWDTHCGDNDEFVELTRIYYPDTHVFTICFDVSNLAVFSKIKKFWVDQEVRPLNPNAPIILVATKTDLRDSDCATISKETGQLLAEEIDAAGYFEVSSLRMEGLDELFHNICVVGLKYQKETLKRSRSRKICGIL